MSYSIRQNITVGQCDNFIPTELELYLAKTYPSGTYTLDTDINYAYIFEKEEEANEVASGLQLPDIEVFYSYVKNPKAHNQNNRIYYFLEGKGSDWAKHIRLNGFIDFVNLMGLEKEFEEYKEKFELYFQQGRNATKVLSDFRNRLFSIIAENLDNLPDLPK